MEIVTQEVPLCQVCNHNHHPTQKCPICGHLGGVKVHRGPASSTLHFKTTRYPGKLTGRKGRTFTKNYIIVKMLRYKIKNNIDFSSCNKKHRHDNNNNVQTGNNNNVQTGNNNRIKYDVSQEEEQKDQQGIHIIGLIGSAPVTVLSMFPADQGYVLLENVGILPSHQRKGYSKKMIEQAIKAVKKVNQNTVGFMLDCPAKRDIFEIFKKLGFHPLAEGAQRFNSNNEQVCRMVMNF